MQKKLIMMLILIYTFTLSSYAQNETDITDSNGIITSQYSDSPNDNQDTVLFDDDLNTKYITYHNTSWIQYQALGFFVISKYSISSAENSPNRDPKNWTLEASKDALVWDTLDIKTDQTFENRLETKIFDLDNTVSYMYYKITMTNGSGIILQLSELELIGEPENDGSTSLPNVPLNLTASEISVSSIELTWEDNSDNENSFIIEVSDDDSAWSILNVVDKGTTEYLCADLNLEYPYYFRVLARNSTGDSEFSNSAYAVTRPVTNWKEKWYEHKQELSLVYYNEDVAVYYDKDMYSSITWMQSFVTDIWKYTKSVYGNFGMDPRLHAIFHQNKYGGGTAFSYFDAVTNHKNVIDLGTNNWNSKTGWNIDATAHEVCHIVEGSAHGVHESPAWDIWKDSKWAEIFVYDVYKHIGMENEASRLYQTYIKTTDNFPRNGTHWFRDWFYPIYDQYGGNQLLNGFFKLLSQHFPKGSESYSRRMNYGEFVHFYSGAAGVSLKDQATKAFGWTDEYEAQLLKAQSDFPEITYEITSIENNTDEVIILEDYSLNQNYPNPFNPETNISFNTREFGYVTLTIYNAIGEKVNTLIDNQMNSGFHITKWNSVNDNGIKVPSGIYFYKLSVNNYVQVKKMILLQ
ncbi:MAG: T9SS type A sorting domain-containing protein [Melioribacteraceae bacterium]|nr:T9SS type A sorting domain-containing protein [Melioribacteraceae bacterium]